MYSGNNSTLDSGSKECFNEAQAANRNMHITKAFQESDRHERATLAPGMYITAHSSQCRKVLMLGGVGEQLAMPKILDQFPQQTRDLSPSHTHFLYTLPNGSSTYRGIPPFVVPERKLVHSLLLVSLCSQAAHLSPSLPLSPATLITSLERRIP